MGIFVERLPNEIEFIAEVVKKTPTKALGGIFGHRRLNHYFTINVLNTVYGTFTWGANKLDASPIFNPKLQVLDTVGIRVTATGTGTTTHLGIYEDNGNMAPGVLIHDCGTVNIGTTGLKEITGLNMILEAGKLYWAVTLHNGTVTLNVAIPSSNVSLLGTDPVSILQGISGCSNNFTYAPLPILFPSSGMVYDTGGKRHFFMKFSA